MEKVRPWCGQPSNRERLRNRMEQYSACNASIAAAARCKNRKIAISQQRFDRSTRNLPPRHILTFLTFPTHKNSQILKIQDGGNRHLEKSKNGQILAIAQLITAKFGTVKLFGTPEHSENWNFKNLTRWLYCVECPQYSTRRRLASNIHCSSMLRKNR